MRYYCIAVIRKDKKDKSGLCPIYVNVYAGRRTIKKLSTGQKVLPDNWNERDRRVRKTDKNAMLKNSILGKMLLDTETKILAGAVAEEAGSLKDVFMKEKFKEVDFFEFADTQLEEKNLSAETSRNRRLFADKFAAFLKWKGYSATRRLSEIDYKLLQQ